MTTLEKKVPKTLGECYQEDRISSELWNWAQWVEYCGRIFVVVDVVIGFFLIIFGVDFEAGGIVAIFFISIICAVLSYLLFKIISLLISALAVIVQNIKVSANVALYNAAKGEADIEVNEIGENNFAFQNIADATETETNKKGENEVWYCPKCSAMVNYGTSTCSACGQKIDWTSV